MLHTCDAGVGRGTYLSLLLVEVVDDDTDEQVEGEEGAEDDEDDEVQVHIQIDLLDRLLLHLFRENKDLFLTFSLTLFNVFFHLSSSSHLTF